MKLPGPSAAFRLVRLLALVIAIGAVGLAVLGMLGGLQQHLDAFAAFRWHAVALAVMALVAARWPARAGLVVLAAPVVILGVPIGLAARTAAGIAVASTPAPPGRAPGLEPRPGGAGARHSLRLVTFNTWDLEFGNVVRIRDMIRATDADVAVLVEVSPPKRALLEQLRADYPFQVECAAHWPCSMAMLSRLPFEAQGTVMPSADRPAAVWAHIAGDDGGLTIVGAHVHRPTRSPRLHWRHMRGLAEVTREATNRFGGQVVVAGDFNTPAWAASMRGLFAQTGLRAMPRTLPTWPAWPMRLPQFPIDHILVSSGVWLEGVGTGDAAGSDHLPIIATVVLRAPIDPDRPRAAVAPAREPGVLR